MRARSSTSRPITPHSAFATSAGSFAGDVIIGGAAAVLGLTHHAAWVVAPAVLGIILGGAFLHRCHAWYRREGKQGSEAALLWWRKRGIWLMLGSSVPAYVAVLGAAIALPKN